MIIPPAKDDGISLSILVDREALDGRGRGIFFESSETSCTDSVNIMATFGRGVVSVALAASRAYDLGLNPINMGKARDHMPMYVTSVEAAACTDTGISATERALTAATLGKSDCSPADIVTPGHIMPVVVPEKLTATAAMSSIAYVHADRYADSSAVTWCDILDNDGDTATASECIELADKLGVPVLIRTGNDAIDLRYFNNRGRKPDMVVRDGGLSVEQFA